MTSIEDPFQLSSYTSSRWKGKKSSLDHVYTTQLNSSLSKSRREGYVTIATQADGIHLVDVSTLHPILSHTLGPSTSFSCPAITIETAPDHYATYAVVDSSPDLTSPDEAGRVVWRWDQKPGSVSSMKESQKRLSKAIMSPPHRIHSLHSDPSLLNRILAVSTAGEIIVLDSETLEQKALTAVSSEEISGVLRVFMFSSAKANFAANSPSAVTIAIAYGSTSLLRVKTVSLDSDDTFSASRMYELPHNTEQVAGISYSESGCFSVLSKDGSWHAYSLVSVPEGSSTSPITAPIKLANLNLHPKAPPSILALTSSHVLLAAASPSSSDIHLQIWDLQYSVLLASHVLPVPSAFANAAVQIRLGSRGPDVSSQGPVRGQAIMVLSPVPSTGEQNTSQNITSNVLIIPYSVSPQSTIAAALGRGSATKQWLKAEDPAVSGLAKSPADAARTKTLADIRTALAAGRTKAAESTFSTWMAESETLSTSTRKEKAESAPSFTHSFVKDLVDALLPPVKSNGKVPYAHSPEILKALMDRRLLFNGMVEGGILTALRVRNDWATIQRCFSSVSDLPVNDIVECLVAVVRNHHKSHSAGGDAMDVDADASSNALPAIPAFLVLVINYSNPATPTQRILALKRHLRDPDDVASVAQTLVTWLRTMSLQKRTQDLGIWPSNKDMEVNEHGVPVYNLQNKEKRVAKNAAKKAGAPPVFEKIISFLQPFLDACFLPLLQHPPSHGLLHELQKYLTEESNLSELLLQLQGALEPFSVTHQKILREAAIPEKEREKQKQKGDWRQRRGGVSAVVGEVGAVGVYQLEELVF